MSKQTDHRMSFGMQCSTSESGTARLVLAKGMTTTFVLLECNVDERERESERASERILIKEFTGKKLWTTYTIPFHKNSTY